MARNMRSRLISVTMTSLPSTFTLVNMVGTSLEGVCTMFGLWLEYGVVCKALQKKKTKSKKS